MTINGATITQATKHLPGRERNAMTNGTTREFVLATFSESPENPLNVVGKIQNGIHYLPFGI